MVASALCLLAVVALPRVGASQEAPRLSLRPFVDARAHRLFAVEYARSRDVSLGRLMRGGGGGTVDMSWYFFVVVGHDRVTLVDVGTDALSRRGRRALRRRWSIATATDVPTALGRTGLSPDDVTDVVLTHHHWDHVGALHHFTSARVVVHEREWRRVPARLREPVEASGRLASFGGDSTELGAGIGIRRAGAHTAHHSMVDVPCEGGDKIIASDAAYLFRSVEERRPSAVTVDRAANLAALRDAARRVGAENVLPGHDPALFDRFPSAVAGVAAICD